MRGMDEFDIAHLDRLKRVRALMDAKPPSHITLVGDVMLDRFIFGEIDTLASTAPVPALRVTNREDSPGAAAHIARSLSGFGVDSRFHSAVGDDTVGRRLIDTLQSYGIETDNILLSSSTTTLIKTRYFGGRSGMMDKRQMILQADMGGKSRLDDDSYNRLLDDSRKNLSGSGILILSDYDNGVITDENAQILLNEAKEAGITTIMDPKLSALGRAVGADVAIFERRGIELIQSRQLLANESETIAHLFTKYEWKAMLVIGGVHGTTLHLADGTMEHHPCRVLNPKQQLGLHDAAATAMSYALLCGSDFGDAACLAHAACEVILNADASREFVSKEVLTVWLDEALWQFQISNR
ncbi:MAG: PfkB family carbohydrate kinase [Candidatus Thermoplasmatota archaeon]|nr:PfkB family carbohydrate kinase [Candidatus Thermoplasmatota archaeon]